MLEVDGKALVGALDALRDAKEIAEKEPTWLTSENVLIWLDALVTQLNNLGCRQTRKKAESIRFRFQNQNINSKYNPSVVASSFSSSISDLFSRLKDELEDQKIYCISSSDCYYFGSVSELFGANVSILFKDQIYDLEEASKSIALDRSTAGVFHLMRVMEFAVYQIGDALNVTISDKNGNGLAWGKIIANVGAAIEKMENGSDRDRWSEIMSLLFHVKQAWRNSTMHPKQTYTIEESREVFMAVRSFLRRLSGVLSV